MAESERRTYFQLSVSAARSDYPKLCYSHVESKAAGTEPITFRLHGDFLSEKNFFSRKLLLKKFNFSKFAKIKFRSVIVEIWNGDFGIWFFSIF